MTTTTDPVQEVRAFNRFWTRVIGVLDAGLAGTRHSLAEARVLYELAHRGDTEVADLRRDLDLDAGYLSRILARLAGDGLAERERSTTDTRRQVVRLTPEGRAAFAELDARQADAVRALLDPLDEERRNALVTAMRRARRQLDEKPGTPAVVLRPPAPGDLGWVVSRHGALYAAEYGWDMTFEALVARVVADFGSAPQRRAAGWIAEIDGERVGSVFCVPSAADPEHTAALRLLLVEPSARGSGLGARLVEECLRFARRSGYRRITLWTVDVLVAARRIYQREAFHLDDENEHHGFGADLVGQNWSRDL